MESFNRNDVKLITLNKPIIKQTHVSIIRTSYIKHIVEITYKYLFVLYK